MKTPFGPSWGRNLITAVCILSLCVNGYFAIQWWRQRSADYEAMDMFPCFLAVAYHSYDIELNPKAHPNAQSVDGRLMMDQAFSALQASRSIYERHGYDTGSVYEWMYSLEFDAASDTKAYQELSDIKSFLQLNGYIAPANVKPLFDAITREYLSSQRKVG